MSKVCQRLTYEHQEPQPKSVADFPQQTQSALVGSASGANAHIQSLDVEAINKAFQSHLLKLSTDMSGFADYQRRCSAGERQLAISRVLKLKNELRRGSQLVVAWLSRNAKFALNSYPEEHLSIAEVVGFTDSDRARVVTVALDLQKKPPAVDPRRDAGGCHHLD